MYTKIKLIYDYFYRCSCKFGFYGDGVHKCEPVDPCSDPLIHGCGLNQFCVIDKDNGKTKCLCKAGFKGLSFIFL